MMAMLRVGIERGTLRPMDDAEIAVQAHFLVVCAPLPPNR